MSGCHGEHTTRLKNQFCSPHPLSLKKMHSSYLQVTLVIFLGERNLFEMLTVDLREP